MPGERGGEGDGFDEAGWAGGALPGYVQSGAVVDRSADDGQSKGDVDAAVN